MDIVKIVNWSKGNPGALSFLISVTNSSEIIQKIITKKLDQISSLRGTNIYVLWNDLCEKNMDKVKKLCENCPNDILMEACNRQDYSGVSLIKKYLD